jgi:hypothetical protein
MRLWHIKLEQNPEKKKKLFGYKAFFSNLLYYSEKKKKKKNLHSIYLSFNIYI